MSIKIIINGRFLTQQITGVQRYAREVVEAIDSFYDLVDVPIELVCPQGAESLKNLRKIKQIFWGNFNGHLWEQSELPKYAKKNLLINLCNMAPVICKNQIVVIHDAAIFDAPYGYTKPYLLWYRLIQKILVLRGVKIVTVSEFSRQRLSSVLQVNQQNISIIGCAVDHIDKIIPDENILNKLNISGKRYLLSVGSKNPNKNIAALIDAMSSPALKDISLVLAGGGASYVFGSTNTKKALPSNVFYSGYVSDNELIALYKGAQAFIFPSKYEGFGMPPLEAMKVGCPVIASNSASIPEVCGSDVAIYFDPDDYVQISKTIADVINNQEKLEQMSYAGLKHSENFVWILQAKKMLALVVNQLHDLNLAER